MRISDWSSDVCSSDLLITKSNEEHCNNITELVKIFWGHLCSAYTEYDIIGVYAGGANFSADQILEWRNFEQIFQEKNLAVSARVRSEERRVGQEGVSRCVSRWAR